MASTNQGLNLRKKLTFAAKDRTPSPKEEEKKLAGGKIKMSVFEDGEDSDDDKPAPVKPLRPQAAKKPVDSDDEDEGDFKNKLQAMLMRGPPPQIHRKTHAPQQAASSNPEDLFDEKMALPKMQ